MGTSSPGHVLTDTGVVVLSLDVNDHAGWNMAAVPMSPDQARDLSRRLAIAALDAEESTLPRATAGNVSDVLQRMRGRYFTRFDLEAVVAAMKARVRS